MIYNLEEDIPLMCLLSPKAGETAASTMSKVERALPTLRGRRFYGLFKIENNVETYYSCTRIEPGDEPEKLGFERIKIGKGKYDREKLSDWEKHWDGRNIAGLGDLFTLMTRRNEGNIDESRFEVEYYRSQKELYAMVPIK